MPIPTYRAVRVPSAGAAFELYDLQTTPPGRDQVRIDMAACGVCGTDHNVVNGVFPGMSFPVTPGHEAAGTVAEVGEDVQHVAVGDRVAVGWFGGNCGHCEPCRSGLFIHCTNGQVPSRVRIAASGAWQR